jgi:hypothetical protein
MCIGFWITEGPGGLAAPALLESFANRLVLLPPPPR